MLDFHEVNFGVRTRENIGQISSVKPSKKICHVTMTAVYSKDVSSRVSLTFINFNAISK